MLEVLFEEEGDQFKHKKTFNCVKYLPKIKDICIVKKKLLKI